MISCADYARKMGRSTRTIRRWIEEGRIEAIKQGRYWYILENNEQTPERMFASDDMDIERSSSGHERPVDVDEIDEICQLEQKKRQEELQEREENIRRERRDAEIRVLREKLREQEREWQRREQERQRIAETAIDEQQDEQQSEQGNGVDVVKAFSKVAADLDLGSTLRGLGNTLWDWWSPRHRLDEINEEMNAFVELTRSTVELLTPPPVTVEGDGDDNTLEAEGGDNDEGDAGLGLDGLVLGLGLVWLLSRKQ